MSSESSVCCQGCKITIKESDDIVMALEHYYHLNCVKCSYCKVNLMKPASCYTTRKGARLFCEQHYFQAHSPHCALCGKRIKSTESIRSEVNENLFLHTSCLICAMCDRPIPPNGRLNLTKVHEGHMQEGRFLLCDEHHKSWLDPKNIEAIKKARAEKAEEAAAAEQTNNQDANNSYVHRHQRTLLSREQFQVLNAAFSVCSKPGRELLAQLCERTKLTERVVRVWFQNKRSKERKLTQERESMQARIETLNSLVENHRNGT